MGGSLRKLFDKVFGNQDMRVVMLGLDAAGKTTILYKLHIGEVLSTVPTIGKPAKDPRRPFLSRLADLLLVSDARSLEKASTWRRFSTRTWCSLFGTSAGRPSSGRCGATTSTTRTA
mmetsp:Transcript_1585/g.5412  ORF Transcript_1585/g.5412 Transcript_1585/m.5412 type:complete len:117 (+) Transcript_1585:156-506(+)